uniref:Uncharacterized protein n=1 Tax=uncultured marine virus TaxID=186617 RepID=S4TEG7_9VIRU|nr:hypothetical protein [uncultured marine virus]
MYKKRLHSFRKNTTDKKQNKDIKRLKTEVKRLKQGEEIKWYDIAKSSTAISSSGSIQPLLALDVWTSGNNTTRQNSREGNSINMLSYKLRGEVYIDPAFASPDASNKIRVLLVQMTDDNITPPALTDILEDTTSSASLYSFLKIKGQRRFKVHYDKQFNLQNTNQDATPYSTPTEPFRRNFVIKAKIPKKGMKVSYSQGSISGNGPVVNGFFLVAYSDSGVISHPAMVYRSRMRFADN